MQGHLHSLGIEIGLEDRVVAVAIPSSNEYLGSRDSDGHHALCWGLAGVAGSQLYLDAADAFCGRDCVAQVLDDGVHVRVPRFGAVPLWPVACRDEWLFVVSEGFHQHFCYLLGLYHSQACHYLELDGVVPFAGFLLLLEEFSPCCGACAEAGR